MLRMAKLHLLVPTQCRAIRERQRMTSMARSLDPLITCYPFAYHKLVFLSDVFLIRYSSQMFFLIGSRAVCFLSVGHCFHLTRNFAP